MVCIQETQSSFKVYGKHLYAHIPALAQSTSDLIRMVSSNIKEAFEALLRLALLYLTPGDNLSDWLLASPEQAFGLLIGSLYNT